MSEPVRPPGAQPVPAGSFEVAPATGAARSATAPPVLELRGVSAAYGRYRALFEVSLSVPAGSVTALVGPNGAGKSTIARVVTGLVPLDQGHDRVRRRGRHRPFHLEARSSRHRPRSRGALGVRHFGRRGQPPPHVHARPRAKGHGRSPGAGLRALSGPRPPAPPAGGDAVWGRAADVGAGPRARRAAETARSRRALARAGAPCGRRRLQGAARDPRRGHVSAWSSNSSCPGHSSSPARSSCCARVKLSRRGRWTSSAIWPGSSCPVRTRALVPSPCSRAVPTRRWRARAVCRSSAWPRATCHLCRRRARSSG